MWPSVSGGSLWWWDYVSLLYFDISSNFSE
jgi:hypothetical protein